MGSLSQELREGGSARGKPLFVRGCQRLLLT